MTDRTTQYIATRFFDGQKTFECTASFADAVTWIADQMNGDAEWARPQIRYGIRLRERRITQRRQVDEDRRKRPDRRLTDEWEVK